ncbi:hypothetical protein J1605_006671 [Eschrichtius robustus]|uniref:40S ribosomal protein S12 n=1 Tax=Eschrichtius robustus TaxID=9764 RepID=A0AB34H365_ESCRO|nr:hypothetical protein J1605_006671 [Eschrichtius robustus]
MLILLCKRCCKTALIHDGLACGIREAAKALDKLQAHLCAFASNCDEPMDYGKQSQAKDVIEEYFIRKK